MYLNSIHVNLIFYGENTPKLLEYIFNNFFSLLVLDVLIGSRPLVLLLYYQPQAGSITLIAGAVEIETTTV